MHETAESKLGHVAKLPSSGVACTGPGAAWRTVAEVKPLQTPFTPHRPIAPDCLVPNSTLRKRIGYVPPPDPLSQPQQLPTDTNLPSALPESRPNRERHRERRGRRGKRGRDGKEIINSLCHKSQSELKCDAMSDEGEKISVNRVNEEVSEDEVNEVGDVGVNLPEVPSSTSGYGHWNAAERVPTDDGRSLEEFECPLAAKEAVCAVVPEHTPTVQPLVKVHRQPERGAREKAVVAVPSRPLPVASPPATPPLPSSPHTSPVTKALSTLTIPYHSQPPTTRAGKHTTHMAEDSCRDGGEVTVPVDGGEREKNRGNEEETFLRQVMRMAHFASDLVHSITTAQGVCEEIVAMLRCVDVYKIDDIISATVQLKQECELTEAQLQAVVESVVGRLMTGDDNLTQLSTLRALERVGVATDDEVCLLAILPFLLSPNLEMRKSAFGALRVTAGITSRTQLHRKLIEMGILQHIVPDEEEILKNLSGRLKVRKSYGPTSPQPSPRKFTPQTNSGYVSSTKSYENSASRLETHKKGCVRPPHTVRVSATQHSKSGKRRNKLRLTSLQRSLIPSSTSAQHVQVLVPTTTATHCRELRRSNQTGARALFPLSARSAQRRRNAEIEKVQKLMTTRPNLFSQSCLVRAIMTGFPPSPGARVGDRAKQGEKEFKWSEVFAVENRYSDIRLPQIMHTR